jgi:hypothetical protein
MSMTGLASPGGAQPQPGPRGPRGRGGINARDYLGGLGGRRRIQGRRLGGTVGWGGPGSRVQYNVNETGPENVYSGGAVTRGTNPRTISPPTGGYVTPNENPGGVEGGYNFQTDPGYEFRLGEGQRVLERGAAAAGGLLSGGYGRRAIRYGQDYASNEYTNVYNRIANIAGIGQTANQQSGQAALYAGAQMGNAASNAGFARASGYARQGDIWANAGNQIANLPWGDIFKDRPDMSGEGWP